MKRPDKWERELAEKLADRCCNHIWMKRQFVDAALPILTASVGTLLQAERAATITLSLEGVDRLNDECDGWVRPSEYENMLKELLTITPDASALSAVVQRETAKLRELLREAAKLKHITWNDGQCGACAGYENFDDCQDEFCLRAKAALQ